MLRSDRSPRSRAVGRALSPRIVRPSLPRAGIDAEQHDRYLTEVQLEAGKIGLLALEIALYGSDGLGHLRCGHAGFDAGRTAQQSSFGRFRAFGRQLEARDAHIVTPRPEP